MRILLISDIHANLEALDAVVADAEHRAGFSQVWTLGDIVGYGPSPVECAERLMAIGAIAVAGNHDLVCCGHTPVSTLSGPAMTSAKWTITQLDITTRRFLASLPPARITGDFTLVHGSPGEPAWEYILSPRNVESSLSYLTTRHCLMGHSHRQLLFKVNAEMRVSTHDFEMGVESSIADARFFINPGSVGQPRDGDWRAAYAILDTSEQSVAFHRVEYDISAVETRMKRAGLPGVLIGRMKAGRARTSSERRRRLLTGKAVLSRTRFWRSKHNSQSG